MRNNEFRRWGVSTAGGISGNAVLAGDVEEAGRRRLGWKIPVSVRSCRPVKHSGWAGRERDEIQGSGGCCHGAARGIGRNIALALVAEGAKVVAVDVDEGALQALHAEADPKA
jgi:hypothetical protein